MKSEASKAAKKPRTTKSKLEFERKLFEKFATKEEFQSLKQEVKQSSEMLFKHFHMFEKNISTIISGEVKHMNYRMLLWILPFMLSSIGVMGSLAYHIILKSH